MSDPFKPQATDHVAGQPRSVAPPRAPGGPLMQIRLTALSLAVQLLVGQPHADDDVMGVAQQFYRYITEDPE